jgi:co-chaperonin GroES (HSP10)
VSRPKNSDRRSQGTIGPKERAGEMSLVFAERGKNQMKIAEAILEIVGKKKRSIKISHETLEVKKGDRVSWKKKTGDKFNYKIIFPEHSPFKEANEFMAIDANDITLGIMVDYDHEICGWKRFKYLIIASDGTTSLYLDPELIIPKNARA